MDSEAIFSGLYSHLVRRGLRPSEIKELIKTIFEIVNKGTEFDITVINSELEKKGWPKDTMDEMCHDLIVKLFEYELKYGK